MKARSVALVSLWMAGALLCFTAIALAVRMLSPTLTVFEILAARNVIGLFMLLVGAACYTPWRAQFRPHRPGLQVLRSGLHFAGQYGWSYAVAVLPLATAFALEFTAPIWLALIAILVLGERVTVSRVGAIALGLIGVLVILRPGLHSLHPAAGVMLLAALAFAGTAAFSKLLADSVSTFSILLWMNIIQILLNLFTADPLFWSRLDPSQIPAVLMLGIAGLASHLCLLQAYRYGDAIVVMPLDFLRIPLIAAIGWSLYGEPLDAWVFLGAGIIIGGILWNLSSEARTAVPPNPSRTPGSRPAS